jgi:hypothetical protein
LLFDEAGVVPRHVGWVFAAGTPLRAVERGGTDVPTNGLASRSWDVTGSAGFTAGTGVFVAEFGVGGIVGGRVCAFGGAAAGMEGGAYILPTVEDGDDGNDSVGEVCGVDGRMCSVRDSDSEKGNPFGKLGVLVEHSNNPLPSVTRTCSGAL